MVVRGGLEPPASALFRPERRGVEYATSNDLAGCYQAWRGLPESFLVTGCSRYVVSRKTAQLDHVTAGLSRQGGRACSKAKSRL